MKYLSTRGGITPLSFKDAVMMGLATDGGLLLPERLPRVEMAVCSNWAALDYPALAATVMGLFIDDIAPERLQALCRRSYASFAHPAVTPLVACGDLHILELFHGPTLAFKDVALQLLGNLFAELLAERDQTMNILGATSGDTGSAAIHGVRGKPRINIFILHPHGRVSRMQELQMTTVTDANVFNIAVRGTFDDGQAIIKAIFSDIPFKERHRLGAINSINWARVLAQVVYYVKAWLALNGPAGVTVDFAVPTGNFGDIFAGYVAKRLLPVGAVGRLILATNRNDILARFVRRGEYSSATVTPTCSPSMDIQVASNFERYLYYLLDEDAGAVREAMAGFARSGRLELAERHQRVADDFVGESVSEDETIATIRQVHAAQGYLLDPHTAVGVCAAQRQQRAGRPLVCLATAHPAKFGDAVQRAIGREPVLPPALAGLEGLPSRCEVLDADAALIRDFVSRHAL
ncbi:MAG: threonine synthase [Desulfobulbaceae bacterium A2]|nr:MAG: threonine synthase [Desulfobulbaceae bacterium A2]